MYTVSPEKNLPGELFFTAKDENFFVPVVEAGFDSDRRFRQVEQFGNKGDHCFIGPAFNGGSGEAKLKGIVVQPGYFIPTRLWQNKEFEKERTVRQGLQIRHGIFSAGSWQFVAALGQGGFGEI